MSGKERRQGECLASRQIYQGRSFRFDIDRVRLPNGVEMDFEMIHHPGAAAVVPVLADGDGMKVVMIRQYRYATGGWLLEIPAGKLNPGEPPEHCAARETEEEVGYQPGRLIPLGWIWSSPGFLDEKIWLYLAADLKQTQQATDHDEVLEIERIPLREAIDKAARGEIHDVKSACALLRAAHHLDELGELDGV
ncbi:MAG TPA: NUDIX hydrolase [Thermoanaerobaculia bacterium]|nr:NUDIX hydrolase [Thermoanaerobaculia bacterium]